VYKEIEEFFAQVDIDVQGDISEIGPMKCTIVTAYNSLNPASDGSAYFICDDASFVDKTTGAVGGRRLVTKQWTLQMKKLVESQGALDALVEQINQVAIGKDAMNHAVAQQAVADGFDPSVVVVLRHVAGARPVIERRVVVADPEKSEEDDSTGAVIGIVIGVLFVILLIAGFAMYKKKQTQKVSVVPA
jgi:hypothetical protein